MKLWLGLAAALALAAVSGVHAQTLGQSDDYVCNHGDPSDEATKQACARLRGDSEAAQFDESVPVRQRRAQAPPPAPLPAPPSAAKGAVADQTLGSDASGSVAPAPAAPALAQTRPAPAPASLAAPSAGAGPSTPGGAPGAEAHAQPMPAASAPASSPAGGLSLLAIGGWISIAAGSILGLLAIVLYIGERSAKVRSPA